MREKPLVLVIDDEERFLEIMRLHLATAGFEPASFLWGSLEEVVAFCESLMPDLVLLDIYLSGKPAGLEVASAIKENPATRDVKLVFWSSFNKPLLDALVEDQAIHSAFGEEDFLDKTEDLGLVTRRIHEILAKKEE